MYSLQKQKWLPDVTVRHRKLIVCGKEEGNGTGSSKHDLRALCDSDVSEGSGLLYFDGLQLLEDEERVELGGDLLASVARCHARKTHLKHKQR